MALGVEVLAVGIARGLPGDLAQMAKHDHLDVARGEPVSLPP